MDSREEGVREMKKLLLVLAILAMAVPVFGAEYQIFSATDGRVTVYAIMEENAAGQWVKSARVSCNYFDTLADARHEIFSLREVDRHTEEAKARSALREKADRGNLWMPIDTDMAGTRERESIERTMKRASEEAAKKADEKLKKELAKILKFDGIVEIK
jgi:hypothetical protein